MRIKTTTLATAHSNLFEIQTTSPPAISFDQFGDSPPNLPSRCPPSTDDFSASYSTQRMAIMSHLPDTLVLNHHSFLTNLWPGPLSMIDLFGKFYDIVETLQLDQNLLVYDPTSVEVYHFSWKTIQG